MCVRGKSPPYLATPRRDRGPATSRLSALGKASLPPIQHTSALRTRQQRFSLFSAVVTLVQNPDYERHLYCTRDLDNTSTKVLSRVHKIAMAEIDSPPSQSQRDPRIDALRGLALVVMTWDHLPNPWRQYTYQSFGFVSAAEVFVFLSGTVTAWVYGRYLIREGSDASTGRALRRVRLLYFVHIALLTIFFAANQMAPEHSEATFAWDSWKAWIQGATFIFQPALLDILPMYCLFIAVAPLLLKQLSCGRSSMVLAISAGIWVIAQFPGNVPYFMGAFNPLAWQLLFVCGMMLSFPAVMQRKTKLPRPRFAIAVVAIVAGLFFVFRHPDFFHLALMPAQHTYSTYLTARDARSILHPFRLIDFAALAYLVWSIPRSFEDRYGKSMPYASLSFLGKHSLQVFAWSSCICFFARMIYGMVGPLSVPLRTSASILLTATLWLPAWLHARFAARSRQGMIVPSRTARLRPASRPRALVTISNRVG